MELDLCLLVFLRSELFFLSLEASKIARPFFRSEVSFEDKSLVELLNFDPESDEVDVFLVPKHIFSFIGGLANGVFKSVAAFLVGVT